MSDEQYDKGPPGGFEQYDGTADDVEWAPGVREQAEARIAARRARRHADTVTAAEAAEVLGKSRRTIGRMLNAGRFPGAERTPNGWRIPRAELGAAAEVIGRPVTYGGRSMTADEFWEAAISGELSAEPAAPPAADAGELAELQAELAEWRRRAEVAEAIAAERADSLADARSALALAQRLAALNLVENAPYRDAQAITEQATPARRWLPRRWRNR